MKIIRPYSVILNPPTLQDSLGKIEWCGRISHRSEEAQTADSWKRFIETVVVSHGDWSIVEHVSVTVDTVVDRGITHEWVRHRLFSFTQESTRFVNYEKKMPPSFIYPKPDIECEHCLNGSSPERRSLSKDVKNYSWTVQWGHQVENGEYIDGYHKYYTLCAYDKNWLDCIAQAEEGYKVLLSQGWRPQEARSVFPNALASRIITTGNLRNWRHFLIMRTTLEAHPQIRQVCIPLLEEFKKIFPVLFDDIISLQKQSEAMRKPR